MFFYLVIFYYNTNLFKIFRVKKEKNSRPKLVDRDCKFRISFFFTHGPVNLCVRFFLPRTSH